VRRVRDVQVALGQHQVAAVPQRVHGDDILFTVHHVVPRGLEVHHTARPGRGGHLRHTRKGENHRNRGSHGGMVCGAVGGEPCPPRPQGKARD